MDTEQQARTAIDALERRRRQNRMAQRKRRQQRAELERAQQGTATQRRCGIEPPSSLPSASRPERSLSSTDTTLGVLGRRVPEQNIPPLSAAESAYVHDDLAQGALRQDNTGAAGPPPSPACINANDNWRDSPSDFLDMILEPNQSVDTNTLPSIAEAPIAEIPGTAHHGEENSVGRIRLPDNRSTSTRCSHSRQRFSASSVHLPTPITPDPTLARDAQCTATRLVSDFPAQARTQAASLTAAANGAGAGVVCNRGKTALHISAEKGHVPLVLFFLAHGVEIDGPDSRGCTALHHAVRGAHVGVVTRLLASGADPEARDNDGRSPLHVAADVECEEIVRLLTKEGVNLNAVIGFSSGEE